MILLDGRKTAADIKEEIALEVSRLVNKDKKKPHLAAIIVGDDGASITYVNAKVKACERVGFESTLIRLPENTSEKELLNEIEILNVDNDIDGFIVQLPLPDHIDEQKIIMAVDPDKDVDGFHPTNVGKMALNLPTFLPATPFGILELLERYKVETSGKHVVVIGRSHIVGSPMSILMSQKRAAGNATVTITHSRTKNLKEITLQADIIVAALGIPEFLTADMVKDGVTVIDVIRSLYRGEFYAEAENLLFLVKLRVSGDYLQTSSVVRDGHVISAINDPNNYTGPGTGHRLTEARRKELAAIRDVLDRDEVLRAEAASKVTEAKSIRYQTMGPAIIGKNVKEIVVGVSPGFGSKIFRTLAGHRLSDVLAALKTGIEHGHGSMRLVRLWHTADTSFLGLSAARLSGSGLGIGLQSKGTAVIHQKNRLPHNNLELFSNAPITTLKHYEKLGFNSTVYAGGDLPDPIIVPTKGEALGARFHARVALTYAIETAMTKDDASPEDLEITFLEVR